jgi:uncharacterized protein (TIGR03067 family)
MLAAGLLIAGDAPKEAEKKEMESPQGTWTVVNEGSLRQGEKWGIAGGRIQEGEGDKLFRSYNLDPRKMPKEIDTTVMASEDGPPLVIYSGIYSLEGDHVKVYLVAPGKERPAAFPQEPGLTPVLILKRQKP